LNLINNEKNILNIIRFGAIVPILIFSLLITYGIILEKNILLKEEIDNLRNEYLHKNKSHVTKEVQRVIDSINYEVIRAEQSLKDSLKEKVY
jgi:signal transduction histidine kinase